MSRHGIAKRVALPAVVLSLALAALLAVRSLDERVSSTPPVAGNVSADPCSRPDEMPKAPMSAVEMHADSSPNQVHFMNPGESQGSEPESGTVPATEILELTIRPEHASGAPVSREPGYVISGKVISEGGPVREEPGQWPRLLMVRVNGPGYARDCWIDEQGGFRCAGLDGGSYVASVRDVMERRQLLCEPVEVTVSPEAPSREVTFVLRREVPVIVMVLERDGLAPVSDAAVVAKSVRGSGEAAGRTDEQGCCVLNLVAGRYRIDAPQGEEGRQVAVDPQILVVGPAAEALSVRLLVPAREQRVIRAILVDARDNPVKGYVRLDFADWEKDKEPAESFSIAAPDDLPAGGLGGYACDVPGNLARRFRWQEDAGQMTVVLEPRAKIVGRLVSADGQPVFDARLSLQVPEPDDRWRSEDDSLYTLVSDTSGNFQFEGVAVGLPVRVAVYRRRVQSYSDPIDLKPGETHDIGQIVLKAPEMPPPTGYVRARVIDEKGEPVANRLITVSTAAGREGSSLPGDGRLLTDKDGSFTATGLLEDQAVTITIQVPGYGSWSRTTAAGDRNCTFQVYPQGWDLLGAEAPPLVVDRWFNHAPMTWEELRGNVVLLIFGSLSYRDRPVMSPVQELCREYGPRGFVVIAVFDHLPADGSPDPERAVQQALDLFGGAPIAGCFDADANLITDPMPDDRLPATAGATHRLYRVGVPPSLFLIDRAGRVRFCVDPKDLRERVGLLLRE